MRRHSVERLVPVQTQRPGKKSAVSMMAIGSSINRSSPRQPEDLRGAGAVSDSVVVAARRVVLESRSLDSARRVAREVQPVHPDAGARPAAERRHLGHLRPPGLLVAPRVDAVNSQLHGREPPLPQLPGNLACLVPDGPSGIDAAIQADAGRSRNGTTKNVDGRPPSARS